MKSIPLQQRPYQDVAARLRNMIQQRPCAVGDRLPAEREIAEQLNVTRTLVREALIMLEIEGLIDVRRGAGIFVIGQPHTGSTGSAPGPVAPGEGAGPFELLQARQLLESNIAEFAALQVTPVDISKMRQALLLEERELASGSLEDTENGDMQFHLAIAEATHNSMLVELFRQSWQWRVNNPMWVQLHRHLSDSRYREAWLGDHKKILAALIKKDASAAKFAMWQHLENVKQRLLECSDVDDLDFDGYLFESWPLSGAS
ncbi:FCD domain-containing protein [Erwinia psidii]|uniref:GntR family transcriptional regulator n=1 Tax=Erwinia psidii TaxID=69224 RepID=A0A3N6UUR5_9GAMM|nr:FCD domain-containing protein [Erwinia psidii]MCX8956356.1 GntR family transcriptional regulator [Erwinia psidii]MCX8959886.1 GntR family transcriptional regulator [Erwinia psidii]MCX8966518.1 GntR family transcriptional regulator [Erwinia psidii]RQM36585.1 GntR family transcriptional regulator [Erwinia psidii]